jgi:cold shock CspA family protein
LNPYRDRRWTLSSIFFFLSIGAILTWKVRQRAARAAAHHLSNKLEIRVQYQGTLKFFKSERFRGGYGFLRRDNTTIDDFLHVSALHSAGINPDSLEEGVTRFSYALIEDPKNKKTKATDLKILD